MAQIEPVPPPRPASGVIVNAKSQPTFLLQGWFRALWNMINGTLNQGYTGTVVISGTTYTYQNGVLILITP